MQLRISNYEVEVLQALGPAAERGCLADRCYKYEVERRAAATITGQGPAIFQPHWWSFTF